MAGRRPLPSNVKRFRGTDQPCRMNPDEPEPPAGAPEEPTGLTRDARDEWRRLVAELESMRVLSTVDRGVLLYLANCKAEWMQAERALKRQGLFVRGVKGGRVVNPAQKVRRDARAAYFRGLVEVGLTPSSRARVRQRDADSKADGFDFEGTG